MNGYEDYYQNTYDTWKIKIEREIKKKGFLNFMGVFDILGQYPLMFPVGERITTEQLTDCSETAIYVVARQAGEGADRKVEKGDFLLADVEYDNIKLLSEHYAHLIVVINCGGLMDLSFMDEIPKIDALFYISQLGTEGGNALAEVLTGKESPSGKLTDTWALNYQDYPAADTYSYRNGNTAQEDYREGIYVGYRWFDAKGIKARYPFGYGMSYTEFSCNLEHISKVQEQINLQIQIKNIGNLYKGKEVVQVYVTKPQKSNKEKKALIAFAKTKELVCGEDELLNLSINIRDLAFFDSSNSQWIIEQGNYGLWIGNSSNHLTCVAVVEVVDEIITEQVDVICENVPTWKDDNLLVLEIEYPDTAKRLIVSPEDVIFRRYNYQEKKESYDTKVGSWLEQLNDKELVALTVGGSLVGKCYNNTPGAVGRTTSSLIKKGIVNINFADGPAGLNVFPEMVITKSGSQKYLNQMPDSYNWGIIKKLSPFLMGKPEDGRPCYQYMTAWPAETLQAQTWNQPLLQQLGEGVGREMIAIGVTLWLAPGMNIHRNPLCGRSFEYYSEDPYMTGRMAAAITVGVQNNAGVGVTIKHFCCNNQEDNRTHVSSNVSERALREIYLKGFEICVREARPWAVMSPYNKVNGAYVNNVYSLCTKVLRNEWGFDGLVMTDWSATGDGVGSHIKCAPSGNDLIMPGSGRARKEIYVALKKGQIKKSDIRKSAARVLQLIAKSKVNI